MFYVIRCILSVLAWSKIHLPAHITFYFQVRARPKLGRGYGHMDEVNCGGHVLNFYAVVWPRLIRIGLLKIENKVNFCHFWYWGALISLQGSYRYVKLLTLYLPMFCFIFQKVQYLLEQTFNFSRIYSHHFYLTISWR